MEKQRSKQEVILWSEEESIENVAKYLIDNNISFHSSAPV